MKFTKLKLDESLFDDDFEMEIENTPVTNALTFDDDFAMDEDFMEGPEEGIDTGIADTIMNLINDEWEAVQGYNNFVELLRNGGAVDEGVIKVIQDIAAEENKHVGQLQELLKKYSPNANQIKVGEQEAQSQMAPRTSMIAGLQFWDTPKSQDNTQVCAEDEVCTLVDADDEF